MSVSVSGLVPQEFDLTDLRRAWYCMHLPRIAIGCKMLTSMPNMTGRPGHRTMEINGGSSAPYFACTPCVPLFCTSLIGVKTEALLDYQGRAGDHVHCTVEPSPGHIRCRLPTDLHDLAITRERQRGREKKSPPPRKNSPDPPHLSTFSPPPFFPFVFLSPLEIHRVSLW